MVKRHTTPIHTLFHIFNIQPANVETVIPTIQCLNAVTSFITEIADTWDESKQANIEDTVDTHIYADGSGIDGMAGAAAVLYKSEQIISSLRYCLGTLEEHTTYEAEGVGVLLALKLLQRERGIKSASIRLDNQGILQSLAYIRSKPGQYILKQIPSPTESRIQTNDGT